MNRLPLILSAALAPLAAQPPFAALLPAETAVLVECDDLRALLDGSLALLAPLPPRAEVLVLAASVALWARLGTTVHGAVAALAPAEMAFSVVVPREGRPVPCLLARVADEERARAVLARLPQLGAHVGDGVCALLPSPAHVERWRRFLDSPAPRLASLPGLRAGAPPLPRPGLRVYVDLARVRGAREWFRTLDPAGAFLLGPLAAALDRSTRLDATLAIDGDELRATARLDGSALDHPARLLLAVAGTDRPALPLPAGTLAAADLDRSLRGYLQNLDALLPEELAARVRAATANLDALLGGASFAGGLLAGLAEPIRFVAVAGGEAGGPVEGARRPRIDLPGFALVAKVEAARATRLLVGGFHRLALVLSAQRAMQRLPPRLPLALDEEAGRLYVLRGPPFAGAGEPPTSEQIEATLAFGHGYAVLATTPHCARQVLAAVAGGPAGLRRGDLLHLSGEAIAGYVRRNAGAIALGRVLDQGETRAQAAEFVAALADALAAIAGADLRVEPGAAHTDVQLTVRRAER